MTKKLTNDEVRIKALEDRLKQSETSFLRSDNLYSNMQNTIAKNRIKAQEKLDDYDAKYFAKYGKEEDIRIEEINASEKCFDLYGRELVIFKDRLNKLDTLDKLKVLFKKIEKTHRNKACSLFKTTKSICKNNSVSLSSEDYIILEKFIILLFVSIKILVTWKIYTNTEINSASDIRNDLTKILREIFTPEILTEGVEKFIWVFLYKYSAADAISDDIKIENLKTDERKYSYPDKDQLHYLTRFLSIIGINSEIMSIIRGKCKDFGKTTSKPKPLPKPPPKP
jgi:hypothetical protein